MAVIENRFVCDLSKPVQAQALKGNVFSLDNLGSRLSVLIYENGQPATISGSVTANCILPDGSTVNVNGDLTTENGGSKAYVDIPQSCLLIPGILKIAIKCTSSSVITTLAAIVANVYMTKTDNVITPSQQIITDWNAEISASLANQDAEISNIKSAFDACLYHKVFYEAWNNGYVRSNGTIGSDSAACVTDKIIANGYKYVVSVVSGYKVVVHHYKSDDTYVGALWDQSTGTHNFVLPQGDKFRVQIRIDSGTLSPSGITDSIHSRYCLLPDDTLSESKKNADAYVTGKRIRSAEDDISFLYAGNKEISRIIRPAYENGSINDETGLPIIGNGKGYRTIDYIPTGHKNIIMDSIPSNVKVYVYRYDDSKAFLGVNSTGITEKTYISNVPGYIKLLCRPRESSDTVTQQNCESISLSTLSIYLNDKNTISVTLEGGKLTAGVQSADIDSYNNRRRTAFPIKTNGATTFMFNGITSGTCTAYSFNSNGEYLGYNEINLANTKYLPLRENASYFKFYFINVPNQATMESVQITAINPTSPPEEVKNFAVNTTEGFEYCTYKLTDTSCATARIILPPNYTISGKKVPLILWMDGNRNFETWLGSFSSGKLPFLNYMRDEGFAIASIFGWSSEMVLRYLNCGRGYPYPSPTCLKCIDVGLDYLFSRYNLDETELHIMSKSMGGQSALYFASHPIKPGLKSIGMFAPVLDYFSMRGLDSAYADVRRALAYDLGLQNATYFTSDDYGGNYSEGAKAVFEENLAQFIQINEAWTNLVGGTAEERLAESLEDGEKFWTGQYWYHPALTDIYTHKDRAKIAKIPVKIWGASDDADTPYLKMVEVVEQLKNGGCEAVMETLPRGTGAHSCADVGNVVDSVTTALGITHTNIPIGWIENIAWIRLHMSK